MPDMQAMSDNIRNGECLVLVKSTFLSPPPREELTFRRGQRRILYPYSDLIQIFGINRRSNKGGTKGDNRGTRDRQEGRAALGCLATRVRLASRETQGCLATRGLGEGGGPLGPRGRRARGAPGANEGCQERLESQASRGNKESQAAEASVDQG